MENKKGQFQLYAIGGILIIIIIFLAFFFFSTKFRFISVGIALFVLAFVLLLGQGIKKQKTKVTLFLVLLAGGLILIFSSGVLQSTLGSNIKIAIPHQASYKCEAVGSGSPSYQIPTSGIWVAKDDIGVNTDRVTDIKVTVDRSFWESYFNTYFGGGARIRYKLCDVNKNNCIEKTQSATWGTTTLAGVPSALDINTNSLYVVIEAKASIVNSWKAVSNPSMVISYSFQKFGLRLYSTTRDPAGAIICESSCDLSCPSQSYRQKLIGSAPNSLKPYETAPYLEYWETLDYDLNAQGGATVYNDSTKQFCLANAMYSKGEIVVGGITYIYPNTLTKQTVECCTGALISTSSEDKKCVNNKWQVIQKDDKIRCNLGDYQCPNSGQPTCQNKQVSGWSCSGKDSLGKYCVKDSTKTVSCCSQSDCASDQTCQSNKCVGGASNVPLNLTNQTQTNSSSLVCEKWYQEKGVTTSYKYNFLGFKFSPVEKEVCKTANWLIVTIITVMVGLVAVFAVYIMARRRK